MRSVTADELDELARRYNYRRELGFGDLRLVCVFVTIMGSCLVIGGAGLLGGDDGGERLRSLVLLIVGGVMLWFASRFLHRPTRPKRDDDFERELRHRGHV